MFFGERTMTTLSKHRLLLDVICCAMASFATPPAALAASAKAATNVDTEFTKASIENCLQSSNKKYELYESCIGMFEKACIAHPNIYANKVKDITVGPHARACTEQESIWWSELFKDNSQKLQKNTQRHFNDERIARALESTITALGERTVRECGYMTTRWGYRNPDSDEPLVNIQGLDDQFKCARDLEAENAITVYLWNKQLQARAGIK